MVEYVGLSHDIMEEFKYSWLSAYLLYGITRETVSEKFSDNYSNCRYDVFGSKKNSRVGDAGSDSF